MEAARIGFPVAMKIVSRGISHKTEVGGVRLNLGSGDEVVRAAASLAASVARAAPGARVVEAWPGTIEGVELSDHSGLVVSVDQPVG